MIFASVNLVDMKVLIPSVFAFVAVLASVFGVMMLFKAQGEKKIRERLHDVVNDQFDDEIGSVILRDMEMSTLPFLNRLLRGKGWAGRLDRLLVQADIRMRLGSFVTLMGVTGLGSAVAVDIISGQPLAALGAGIFMGSVPLMWARNKKNARTLKFEEQFPDALDMLTSALRAGLALTGAIQVVAEEAPDPVGKEFRVLFEENRLGMDMKHAVKMLGERVDSAEVRLFTTALILQRETGGNLAEILDGTAAVIRDRFRILRDVRTLTAQSRMSGGILILLPLAMAMVVMTMAPEYLLGLWEDPQGKYLIPVAIFLQIVGFVAMRRIVDIKV